MNTKNILRALKAIVMPLILFLLFSACTEEGGKPELPQDARLFSNQPGQLMVSDVMTAGEKSSGGAAWKISGKPKTASIGIIISDTIMLSRIQFDDSITAEVEVDAGLASGEYLERQKVGETIRVQRGPASDFSQEALSVATSVTPFTPAESHRVTVSGPTEICVNRINATTEKSCFSNVAERILVINMDGQIIVHVLPVNLTN